MEKKTTKALWDTLKKGEKKKKKKVTKRSDASVVNVRKNQILLALVKVFLNG